MKGMFSGRQIKDLKGRGQKVTRSQTALSAYNAITGKYGGIVDNAHYFHVGKGAWKKYSLESDKTRTGKIASSKAAWAERPNKFDWEGIDTKESKKVVTNKKRVFSVGQLNKGKVSGRKSTNDVYKLDDGVNIKVNTLTRPRRVIKNNKITLRKGLTWKSTTGTFKITDIKTVKDEVQYGIINVDKPAKVYYSNERDTQFNIQFAMKSFGRKIEDDKRAEYDRIQDEKEKANKTAEYNKSIESLEGFELKFTPMQRAKVITKLNEFVVFNGKKLSRKEHIRERVKSGWYLKIDEWNTYVTRHGENVKVHHNERVLAKGDVTAPTLSKTELDFAEHLIKKWNIKPRFSVNTLANGKMTGRKGDGMKLTGKAVTKKIERPDKRNLKKILNGMKPDAPKEHASKYPYGTVFKAKIGNGFDILTLTGMRDYKGYNGLKHYDLARAEGGRTIMNERELDEMEIISKPKNMGIQIPVLKNRGSLKKHIPKYRGNLKPVTKKEAGTFGHFGEKLSVGKYKEDYVNIKNNVIETLKEKYPDTLFMIVARGFYNTAADVYWTGAPSEASVRKLGLGINKDLVSWGDQARYVYWHNISEKAMRDKINSVEHNKALKTKVKAGYTRKIKASDMEAPKHIIKMPAKIPTKTPAAVPKKQIKGRKVKTPIRIQHTPVLKTGKPKPKVYKGFLVSGNTYPLKNAIKSMGGKWNKDEGGWVVPTRSAKEINKFAKANKLKVTALKTEENVYRHLTEADRLDIRKAKNERKVERWENSASKKSKEASVLREKSHKIVENIPFGQPMLIGHHSYKADRNRRERSWNQLGQSIHLQDEADETARKASVLSNVTDRLGSVSDMKGRIYKIDKERNHAKNKITEAERNLEFARIRKDTDDIERQKSNIKYWQNRVTGFSADIESLKARIPSDLVDAPKAGINISMLGGIKLKPAVGATSVAKRYHNKNLKGGNFAIEVRKGDAGVELNGEHNIDGIVTDLSIGALSRVGASVITSANYQTYTMSKLIPIIQKALENSKR